MEAILWPLWNIQWTIHSVLDYSINIKEVNEAMNHNLHFGIMSNLLIYPVLRAVKVVGDKSMKKARPAECTNNRTCKRHMVSFPFRQWKNKHQGSATLKTTFCIFSTYEYFFSLYMFTPFQTNGIFHTATYNKVSMVDCAHLGVTDHEQILFSFSEDRFVLNSADPEQTLRQSRAWWNTTSCGISSGSSLFVNMVNVPIWGYL